MLLIVGISSTLIFAAPGVKNPTTYTYIRVAEPKTLDPANAMDNVSLVILADIYQRLVTLNRDAPDQVVGDVASRWTISSDGCIYTFYLRKGLRFHDGTPLTAWDVKYSIDRTILMNGSAGVALSFSPVKGAEEYLKSKMTQADVQKYLAANGVQVLDDYTLQITLNYPFMPFLAMLSLFSWVVPENYVESHGGITPGEENIWMARHAMGSGPFKFVEWVPSQHILLERYGNYWKGPAALERVKVEFIAETGTNGISSTL